MTKDEKRGNEWFQSVGLGNGHTAIVGMHNADCMSLRESLATFLSYHRPVAIWQGEDELARLIQVLSDLKPLKPSRRKKQATLGKGVFVL